VYDQYVVGDYAKAVSMFTRSRSLAKQNNVEDAVIEASRNLISTRMKIADGVTAKSSQTLSILTLLQAERQKKYEEAIDNYTQCIDVAKQSVPEKELISNIEYRLGKCFESYGDIEKASKVYCFSTFYETLQYMPSF
jgi:tetratricopeptide (TPR) repeat protein